MPGVDGFEIIINYLSELNYCSSGANGPSPLSWSEIQAWIELTGKIIEPWLAMILMNSSRAYAYQAMASQKVDCDPPYDSGVMKAAERQRIANKIRAAF